MHSHRPRRHYLVLRARHLHEQHERIRKCQNVNDSDFSSNFSVKVSGDNKGFASMLWEEKMNPNGTLPGMGNWVGAVAQSNEGDVSPNTRGAFCDNGTPCDVSRSRARWPN